MTEEETKHASAIEDESSQDTLARSPRHRQTKKKTNPKQKGTEVAKIIRSDVNRPGLKTFFQSRLPFSFTTRSNRNGLANLVVPIYSPFLHKGAYCIRLDPRTGATNFASQKTTLMERTCFFCRGTDTCRCTVSDAFNLGTLLFVSKGVSMGHMNRYSHPMSRMLHLRYLVTSSEVVMVHHATMQDDGILRCTLMQGHRYSTFSYFHVMHNNTVTSFPMRPEKDSDNVLVVRNQDAVACARHACKSLAVSCRYNFWSSQRDPLPFESSANDDGCHLPNISGYMTEFQMSIGTEKDVHHWNGSVVGGKDQHGRRSAH